jgi:Flp pilus assembly pilin Flp
MPHKLDQKGQGLTEYIALLLLIAVVSVTAVSTLGRTVKRKIQQAQKEINSEISLHARD